MTRIRVGMIGAGAIAASHCTGVNHHPNARVVAVADASRERAEAVQEQCGIDKVYTDWAKLVADPEIDAVCIALPNYLHAPVSIAALKAGKHVLLDKPFALDQKEAKACIAAAKKAKRVFSVGMNQRFTREAQTIRALVRRGELGEIYHAKAFWNRRTGSPKFGTWFCNKKLAGGGCLLDIGVHVLDLALSLMDNFEPVCVQGVSYSKLGPRGIGEGGWGKSDREKLAFDVDDLSAAMIRMKNGASVLLEVSWIRHQAEGDRHNVELFGTEAGASVWPTRLFRFGKEKGEYEVVEPQNVQMAYPHCDRMKNWIDSILGKEAIECTLEQSLAVQKILDAIYASAKSGREVRITR